MQDNTPVAYASRTLTPTERRYAQIEKESLGIVFVCERFRHYLSAKDAVLVVTENKPLEVIFKKPLLSAPKRLQQMLLRLQDFNLNVKYKRGSQLYIADTLSQAAQEKKNREHISTSTREASIYGEIEAVHPMEGFNMKATTVERIRGDYEAEPSAKALKEMILIGWSETRSEVPYEIKAYFPHRDELTVDEGIVFKGAKLVIPPSL